MANANEKQPTAVSTGTLVTNPRDEFKPLILLMRRVVGGMQSHEAEDLKYAMYLELDRVQAKLYGGGAAQAAQDRER